MTTMVTALCEVNPCAREAVVQAVAGCVHEHEITGPLCQFHLDRSGQAVRLSCKQCDRRGGGHICRVSVLRSEPLA